MSIGVDEQDGLHQEVKHVGFGVDVQKISGISGS